MRFIVSLFALSLMLAPLAAQAQSSTDRLTEVERKLDAALAELERLKLGDAASESTATYASRHGFAPGASRVYDAAPGPSIGGYGEMLFERTDRTRQDGTLTNAVPRADLLRAVFYVGHKFTPTLLFNSELEFEHAGIRDEAEVAVDPASGEGAAELSGEVVVEFAYLDWQAHPAFGVRAGKLLVPMGLVNEQHEPPVFVGARRPDSERLLVPSTWSGAGFGLYGATASGLEWRAYVVEGLDASHFDAARAVREGRQAGSQARFTHPALAARLDWKGTPGLLVGVSGVSGDAWQTAKPVGIDLSARTTLLDVHARWQWRGLELRGLYVHGSIAQANTLSDVLGLTGAERLGDRFAGGYAEARFDVAPRLWPGTAWALAPYARIESLDTQIGASSGSSTSLGGSGGVNDPALERTNLTLGVAVQPHPNVVLKLDRESRRDGADRGASRWNAALGWMF